MGIVAKGNDIVITFFLDLWGGECQAPGLGMTIRIFYENLKLKSEIRSTKFETNSNDQKQQ